MATLPSIPNLSAETLSGLSEGERTTKVVEAINGLRNSLVAALSGGLTPGNLDAQIHEFAVTEPGWPYTFRSTVKGKPTGVLLLSVQNTETSSTTVSVSSPSWEAASTDGAKAIKIKGIDGLTNGERYRIRLLVLAE